MPPHALSFLEEAEPLGPARRSETAIERAPKRSGKRPRPTLAAVLAALVTYLVIGLIGGSAGAGDTVLAWVAGGVPALAAMGAFYVSRRRLKEWSDRQVLPDRRARHDLGFD